MNIRKYEELYKLSKDGLDEELGRFRRLDEKASNYLSVLSILLIISGLAGQSTIELIIPPTSIWDWLCLASGVAFFASLLIALHFVFSVLKTSYLLMKIPISTELIKFFDDNDYLDIIYALTKGNVGAVSENRMVSDRKVRNLTWGYRLTLVSVFFRNCVHHFDCGAEVVLHKLNPTILNH